MLPDSVDIVLQLDGLAERERHRRRANRGVTAPCGRHRRGDVAARHAAGAVTERHSAIAVAGCSAGGPASAILAPSRPC